MYVLDENGFPLNMLVEHAIACSTITYDTNLYIIDIQYLKSFSNSQIYDLLNTTSDSGLTAYGYDVFNSIFPNVCLNVILQNSIYDGSLEISKKILDLLDKIYTEQMMPIDLTSVDSKALSLLVGTLMSNIELAIDKFLKLLGIDMKRVGLDNLELLSENFYVVSDFAECQNNIKTAKHSLCIKTYERRLDVN